MNKKYLSIIGVVCLILLMVFLFLPKKQTINEQMSIDEILETDSYKILSVNVKRFIKNHYEETGEILLTEDLAKPGEGYLNPNFIEYLDSENQESYSFVPSITTFDPILVGVNQELPSKFDLRNVDGKKFATPNKNQGNEGLCWAYSTASLLETHDLITKNKSYDETATLISEKQFDYATAKNGIINGNKIYSSASRTLSNGAFISAASETLLDRIGGFDSSWNTENNDIISYNGQLDPSKVFDQSRALYEADESVTISNINKNLSDTDYFEKMKSNLKKLVYENGGAVVGIQVTYTNFVQNYSNGAASMIITRKDYLPSVSPFGGGGHALHLIGWDDDYEYSFCFLDLGGSNGSGRFLESVDIKTHECGSYTFGGKTYEETKVTGKGAWILKNSWGSSYAYLYLPYDSYIDEFHTITKYSEKNWDVSNKLKYNSVNINGKYIAKFTLTNQMNYGDKVVKLKSTSRSQFDFDLYYTEDGDTNHSIFLGNYKFDYAGSVTIDLSDKNIRMNSKSFFYGDKVSNLTIFTKNDDTEEKAHTDDYIYSIQNEKPSNSKDLLINLTTSVKNIPAGEDITYKIKDSNGNYLPSNAFSVLYTKVYYNMVTPTLTINVDYAKKGEYTLEAWHGSKMLSTSLIKLEGDYITTNGDGTADNPWQITNTRQFNMIRNAIYDNYILMNDLDFEYDTKNENGIFYNNREGFITIPAFYGNFDGNGKTIKNIKVNGPLFHGYFFSSYSKCDFKECGIHDLSIDNLESKVYMYSQGGILYDIDIYESDKLNFNNLSITNSRFVLSELFQSFNGRTINCYLGGITGNLVISGNTNNNTPFGFKIDNWYSDFDFEVLGESSYISNGNYHIGGLVGSLNISNNTNLSINNSKSVYKYNITKANKIDYKLSDVFGYVTIKNSDVKINNFIGNTVKVSEIENKVSKNAFIGAFNSDSNSYSIEINSSKSSLDSSKMDNVTISNSETGLKAYELARANYNDLAYYEKNNNVYKEQVEGSTKVEFKDKFNILTDLIPTHKKYNETYTTYYDEITIKADEEKNVNDLIKDNTNHYKVNIYGNVSCNLDICNNKTDESIISISNDQGNYTFTGLKKGSTSIIIYDEVSGYIGKVLVNVTSSDYRKLILDYNYDNITDATRTIKKGSEYGELPVLERESYSFLGWFTDKEGGDKVESNTIFNGDKDVTLYAHWKEEKIKYTVKFDSQGGSDIPSQTINYNGKISKPNDPTKKGHKFVYWYFDGAAYDFNKIVKEDMTLYALWEAEIYTITFDANGGSEVKAKYAYYDRKVTKPDNPTRKGYTFKEWQLDGVKYDFDKPVTGNITLVAVWEKNSKNDDDSLSSILTEKGFEIKDNFVSGFTVGDSISEIKEKLGDSNIIINTNPYQVNGLISTGTTIVKDDESYVVVIKGDLTGDGKIDSGDLLRMKKHMIGEYSLTEPFKKAGLIENQTEIKSIDLLRLMQYLLGEYELK